MISMKRIPYLLALLLLSCGVRADLIKQASNYHRMVLMTLASDHITGATGLTLTITESKAGGAFAAATPTVTERGNGWYDVLLTSADNSTLGALNMHISGTAADPTDTTDQIVAFDPTDVSLLGLTNVATASTQTTNTTAVAAIKLQTDKLLFDGSNFVKSNSQTGNVATVNGLAPPANWNLATIDGAGKVTFNNTNIATLGGLAPPANFSLFAIDASGRTILTPTEHGLFAGDVFNATAATYNVAGTFGAKLNAAGSAGDPWATALPGAYGAGTAGYQLSHPFTLGAVSAGVQAPASWFTNQPNVTVGGYATNQDPGTYATAVFNSAIPGTPTAASPFALIKGSQQAGSPVTLPTTPPTGYANPGYFYAPVLDSGASQSTSLTLTVTRNGSNQPVLTWTADTSATSYKVLRSVNGITYTVLMTTSLLTYTDTARPTGNVYYSVIGVH